MLLYLLRPQAQHKMCVQQLLQILKPNFSEDGSNALKKEKEVYQMFVTYVREVAASRRVCGHTTLELSHILQFSTASAEKAILGFTIEPSVEFILPREVKLASQQGQSAEEHTAVEGGSLPTAHTCSNVLELSRPQLISCLCLPWRNYLLYVIWHFHSHTLTKNNWLYILCAPYCHSDCQKLGRTGRYGFCSLNVEFFFIVLLQHRCRLQTVSERSKFV